MLGNLPPHEKVSYQEDGTPLWAFSDWQLLSVPLGSSWMPREVHLNGSRMFFTPEILEKRLQLGTLYALSVCCAADLWPRNGHMGFAANPALDARICHLPEQKRFRKETLSRFFLSCTHLALIAQSLEAGGSDDGLGRGEEEED